MPEKIAFVVHERRKAARITAESMRIRLEHCGYTVFFPQLGEDSDSCKLVLTFGGDGTLLSGAKTALSYKCPLLGINLGTMGFLTESEPEQMDKLETVIHNQSYSIEERGIIEVKLENQPDRFLALNDSVITRVGFARLIQVETFVNHEHWGTFIADGVIAATPTGSTGYSLSAGGPVISPGVNCIVINPVCPHSLQHRPCIVPQNAEILFRLRADRDQHAELQIDGQSMKMLHAGDTIHVTGAKETLKLARIEKYRFFHVLQSKLNEWSQPREDVF